MRKSAACLLALALAAAQPATAFAADPPQQAELADARAIVATIMPPEQRQDMMRTLMQQIGSQIQQAMPMSGGLDDPGLRTLVNNAHTRLLESITPTVNAFLPKLAEAWAIAYTQEFGPAELKEIRAFAETPVGHRYLSRSLAIPGNPVLVEANQAYFRDLRPIMEAQTKILTSEIMAYLEAHPELAAKISAANTAR